MTFDAFFAAATGHTPYDFQRRLACGQRQAGQTEAEWLGHGALCQSRLVNIPTGLGKTAAIVLAWLWNRLSRALHRGYGMSRYRWPMHFGRLNNDCLWVMDETQLMGPGLGTACQLEAFRAANATGSGSFGGGGSVTWYMSATNNLEHLRTREWRSITPGRIRVWAYNGGKGSNHWPRAQALLCCKAFGVETRRKL